MVEPLHTGSPSPSSRARAAVMMQLRAVLHHRSTAWVILALSIVVTILAWYVSDRAQKAHRADRFVFRTGEVAAEISQRMKHYEDLLRGGVALFNASSVVTRAEWRSYVQALQLSEQYSVIQGLGFSLRIPAGTLREHEQGVRAEGFPGYRLWPEGERDEYHAILYLEPFEGRNLRAFGFDMHSEPMRSRAMDAARDSGRPAISSPVMLVQETGMDVQKGFLMYLPVYAGGAAPEQIAQRRAALRGFVYAPFRCRDLMRAVLGDQFADLDYWAYAGTTADPGALLFQSRNGGRAPAAEELQWTRRIDVADRQWTVVFAANAVHFEDARAQPLLIGFGGLLFDALLFLIVSSLARTQQRAVSLANEMTGELRRSLAEKEVLLQEVHHRVKNNLQVISSLISMQLRKPESAPAHDALDECRRRVFAIALIHEKLYRVADFSQIEFGDYARDLANSIVGAGHAHKDAVGLKFSLQPVTLDVEQAVPCGLILQELLSNALKHAFPMEKSGTICIELSASKDDVTLAVSDDGVGFSPTFDPETSPSLGMKLIHILVDQIRARLQIEATAGTRTVITFSRHPKAV